jgi:DUF4097 and DUF4098 domain-containing protein YvlB
MRRETFETPGELTLDLRVPSGRIDLETGPGTTTEIELDARGGADQTRELLEDAKIELRESRSGLVVVVDVEAKRGLGLGFLRRVEIRLRVRSPEGTHVRAETASADLRGRGNFGSLQAKTASGDVDLDQIGGDAEVEAASGDVNLGLVGGATDISTASGDIRLGRADGPLTARAASGDVRVDEASGGTKIRTASGDQRVGAVAEGSVELQSMSGDIVVGIRQGSSLWVDARAMSGDLSSEVELDDVPPSDNGGPLVELRATSMSGDIDVVRA